MPVGGGSGIVAMGIGTAGSSELTLAAEAPSGRFSEPGRRNQPRCIPANLLMPVCLRMPLPNRQTVNQYRSRNLHGARPKPVTQKSAFRICESISTHFLLGDSMSSHVGLHIAGAALQSNKKSMPPQATTFKPYKVMTKPMGVRNHFQKAFRAITVDVVHGSFGGGTYPFAY